MDSIINFKSISEILKNKIETNRKLGKYKSIYANDKPVSYC